MTNQLVANEWDPEGCPDFSEFPAQQNMNVRKLNIENLWHKDWTDEDDQQDFTKQLQQEKKKLVHSERITFETTIDLAPNKDIQKSLKFVLTVCLKKATKGSH